MSNFIVNPYIVKAAPVEATWESDAANNAESYIQPNNGKGNYFATGTTSHDTLNGNPITQITAYFTNGGNSQTISCFIQDASANTLFGTATLATTASNVELTFTGEATLSTGNFVIHFRGQTALINALWRVGTSCSGNCPPQYTNGYSSSPTFGSWSSTSEYGTMTITYTS